MTFAVFLAVVGIGVFFATFTIKPRRSTELVDGTAHWNRVSASLKR